MSESIEQLLPVPEKYSIVGMDVETMVAEFLDTTCLKYPPVILHRINANGRRLYYYLSPDGIPQFFISVTSFIKASMPTNPSLIKWIAEMGYDRAMAYAEERAHYGTFLHIQTAMLHQENGEYDLDSLPERLEAYIRAHKLDPAFMSNAEELKKDVMAYAQFCIDVEYKPIATEIVLCHPEHGYAGAIDRVGTMNIEEKGFWGEVYKSGARKGEPKETKRIRRVMAIIDVKSGRNGFYEEHEVQLEAYREAWNYWFPEMPIEKLYNWSPKEWRGRIPTYNLKDQSEKVSLEKLKHLVAIAQIDERKYTRRVVILSGKIDLKKGQVGLTENISEYGLAEIVTDEEAKREAERLEREEQERENAEIALAEVEDELNASDPIDVPAEDEKPKKRRKMKK